MRWQPKSSILDLGTSSSEGTLSSPSSADEMDSQGDRRGKKRSWSRDRWTSADDRYAGRGMGGTATQGRTDSGVKAGEGNGVAHSSGSVQQVPALQEQFAMLQGQTSMLQHAVEPNVQMAEQERFQAQQDREMEVAKAAAAIEAKRGIGSSAGLAHGAGWRFPPNPRLEVAERRRQLSTPRKSGEREASWGSAGVRRARHVPPPWNSRTKKARESGRRSLGEKVRDHQDAGGEASREKDKQAWTRVQGYAIGLAIVRFRNERGREGARGAQSGSRGDDGEQRFLGSAGYCLLAVAALGLTNRIWRTSFSRFVNQLARCARARRARDSQAIRNKFGR